jgi:hypothetical protein
VIAYTREREKIRGTQRKVEDKKGVSEKKQTDKKMLNRKK